MDSGDSDASSTDSGSGGVESQSEPIQGDASPDLETAIPDAGSAEPTPEPEETDYEPSAHAIVQRASKLRRKARQGIALNDAESEFLADYEARKKAPGRPKKDKPPRVNDPIPETLPAKQSGKRLPPPPIVHESKRSSWVGKYQGGIETGRELVCVQFGDAWHRVLVAMEKQLSDAGIAPIVEVNSQETRNMLICAVNDILPEWVVATPAIVGAYKTTMLSTQRLMKAGAIKKSVEDKKRPIVNMAAAVTAPVQTRPELTSIPKPEPKTETLGNGERIKINPDGHFIR